MNSQIAEFIDILHDNDFVPRYHEIPNEFDHADELRAQIEEQMSLPDSLRYFELNGFSSPDDLADYLKSRFREFRISFIANGLTKDSIIKNEVKKEINDIKIELNQLKQQVKILNDITLIALIDLKIRQDLSNIKEKSISADSSRFRTFDYSGVKRVIQDTVYSDMQNAVRLSGFCICELYNGYIKLCNIPSENIPHLYC